MMLAVTVDAINNSMMKDETEHATDGFNISSIVEAGADV